MNASRLLLTYFRYIYILQTSLAEHHQSRLVALAEFN